MMKFSLDIELTDSQIDDIIEDKKKENKIILISEIKTIKSRIKEYQGDVKNFHKINQWSKNKELQNALLSCYASKTMKIKNYIKELTEKAPIEYQNICPYCCINEVGTLDHILPKGKFSEYSFLPINLIKVCNVCNTIKSDDYKQGNYRLFINPYIDEFLEKEFLKIDLELDEKEPYIRYNVRLDYHNISNEFDKQVIQFHFHRLKLLNRIPKKIYRIIGDEYRRIVRDINRGIPIQFIKDNYREDMNIKSLRLGKNHFETVIARELYVGNYIENLSKKIKYINSEEILNT